MSNHIQNTTLLEVKNLIKTFGEHTILNDISLEIKKGEVCVILGPSGCGKSTFLRCINGLEEIQEGSISFDSLLISAKDSKKTKWNEVRQKIGMVFQNYELFPHLSVMENIVLAPLKVQKRKKKKHKKKP